MHWIALKLKYIVPIQKNKMITRMEFTTLLRTFSCEAKNDKFMINRESNDENISIGLLDLFF
jgi:hypothetical protein